MVTVFDAITDPFVLYIYILRLNEENSFNILYRNKSVMCIIYVDDAYMEIFVYNIYICRIGHYLYIKCTISLGYILSFMAKIPPQCTLSYSAAYKHNSYRPIISSIYIHIYVQKYILCTHI